MVAIWPSPFRAWDSLLIHCSEALERQCKAGNWPIISGKSAVCLRVLVGIGVFCPENIPLSRENGLAAQRIACSRQRPPPRLDAAGEPSNLQKMVSRGAGATRAAPKPVTSLIALGAAHAQAQLRGFCTHI